MSWDDIIEQYLTELRGRRNVASTHRNESNKLYRFQRFCAEQGLLLLTQVDSSHVRAFAKEIERQSLTPLSRYALLGAVRRWLKWAYLRDHILVDPASDWEPRHPPLTLRWVPTEEQMAKILLAPADDTLIGKRDSTLLKFLYGTGLRLQECADVDLQDLDLQLERFTVRQGKGGKSRVLPIGAKLLVELSDYLEKVRPEFKPLEGEKAFFLHSRRRRMNAPSIAETVRRYGLATGFDQMSVHAIRHAYATHLLLNGAPLVAVQRLLGHDTIASTAIYTRILPIDVQTEILTAHPRGKRQPKKPRL